MSNVLMWFSLAERTLRAKPVKVEKYKLLPNESVRCTMHSQELSPLSRPKGLCFLPENFTIDLVGWY